MKTARSFLPLFVFALTGAQAGTINYTYDASGRLVAVDHGAGKSVSYAYDNAGNLIQFSQPSPGLVLRPFVSGQFTIAWPAVPGGFVVESTAALGPGAVWSPVAAPANPMGNLLFMTLSVGPANTFFRLRK